MPLRNSCSSWIPLFTPIGTWHPPSSSLKKAGTCTVNGFFGIEEAVKVIKDCEERYKKEIDPKLVN